MTFRRTDSKMRRRQVSRGELKAKIISALRAAGKGGATIGDLSKKLRVKRANLYVWFNGTGRNERRSKRLGRRHIALFVKLAFAPITSLGGDLRR